MKKKKPYGIRFYTTDIGEFPVPDNDGWVKGCRYETRQNAIKGLERLIEKHFLLSHDVVSSNEDSSAVLLEPQGYLEFDVPGAALEIELSVHKISEYKD